MLGCTVGGSVAEVLEGVGGAVQQFQRVIEARPCVDVVAEPCGDSVLHGLFRDAVIRPCSLLRRSGGIDQAQWAWSGFCCSPSSKFSGTRGQRSGQAQCACPDLIGEPEPPLPEPISFGHARRNPT